jgi:hypothetical protein
MPSVTYQEIVQRIPLLTPEEKERLKGLLHFTGKAEEATDLAMSAAEPNETAPVRLVAVREFAAEREWIRTHREQYRGQFVALAGAQLLAHGKDENAVIDQARQSGVATPFVTYIETEDEAQYLICTR